MSKCQSIIWVTQIWRNNIGRLQITFITLQSKHFVYTSQLYLIQSRWLSTQVECFSNEKIWANINQSFELLKCYVIQIRGHQSHLWHVRNVFYQHLIVLKIDCFTQCLLKLSIFQCKVVRKGHSTNWFTQVWRNLIDQLINHIFNMWETYCCGTSLC